MDWIKITHNAGAVYLNIAQVYRYEQTGSNEITFYDANSILPTSYSFSTSSELVDFMNKLTSILSILDIDQLAPQG